MSHLTRTGRDIAPIEYVFHSDPDGGEGLVATILRSQYDHGPPGTAFLTEPDQPLQVAHMRRSSGEVVPAHVHLERKRVLTLTQEVLAIRSGRVRVDFFTAAGVKFDSKELIGGDVCILHQGGHALEFLADTVMLEVKQGPYSGRDLDKRML